MFVICFYNAVIIWHNMWFYKYEQIIITKVVTGWFLDVAKRFKDKKKY